MLDLLGYWIGYTIYLSLILSPVVLFGVLPIMGKFVEQVTRKDIKWDEVCGEHQ